MAFVNSTLEVRPDTRPKAGLVPPCCDPSDDVREPWLRLIRAEYLEIPGLNLTRQQARRLWNLDQATCDVLLQTLVNRRFLRRTDNDLYVRVD
jgi:hypothetical protein